MSSNLDNAVARMLESVRPPDTQAPMDVEEALLWLDEEER